MLKKIFNNFFVINMDEHPDRYNLFVEEMKKYRIENFERIPGIKINGGIKTKDRWDGNKWSHYRCVELASQRKLNYAIICEDDVIFDERFLNNNILSDFYKFIKNETWDMFYFGIHYKSIPKYTTYEYINQVLKGYAIHCYAIHSRCYDLVIDNFWNKEFNLMSGDMTYANLVHPKGQCFVASPRIALQRQGFSYASQKNKDYNSTLKEISFKDRLVKENIQTLYKKNKKIKDKNG